MNALQQEYHDALSLMQGRDILVIGDMVADIYLDGRISRISREAPVLVLEQAGEKIVAGGAANVVNNIATLGGTVHAAGLVGRDESADGLRAILAKNGADVRGLISDESRPTISKTRIIAGGRATVSQQIVRIDKESKEPVHPVIEAELRAYIESVLPTVEGVVISDYGSGTVTEGLQTLLIDYCRAKGIPSIVDSRYAVHEIPVSDKSEVFDVSGAGDTCVATVILALAAGAEPALAARLSNIASGIAVRKLGTSTVSVRELAEAVEKQHPEYPSK